VVGGLTDRLRAGAGLQRHSALWRLGNGPKGEKTKGTKQPQPGVSNNSSLCHNSIIHQKTLLEVRYI